ncbi:MULTISPECIES: aromatic amino acid DMT transporter YddG [Pantoea]|uniref:aromatic amino acid DMT transporter YddG n=1 Tax=Pantoea TaxID=53335 RepID=UPI000534F780|nr:MULTISPECIES: aromatic amino acid DMT transporter YddG [Pantoea]POW50843.1 drug/metabolite DMT transporter permease [Pantoea alvi]MCG7368671.1 aromatic amino acid DMT transporter YddG [Pantoea sp. ACRSH]MCG7391074.1 aromatic amino acid DMT transporter YddG [Pantoea sp. ACRSB]MCG7399030.1 aromatic amino acid DMT transporter YddG [Pantoea sp. ACRSC]UBN56453.1 aromatic amino acid DMT transporter YddG [Pantoea agglomerans]
MSQKRATLTGLLAIVLWSTIVGLIKSVSESFGPIGGAALIYSFSAALLLFTVGFPSVRTFPRRYLLVGSLLFVSYEICLSLSLGFTNSGRQAIEVGMVNYLWPGMTIVLAALVNRQKTSPLIIPGLLLAVAGICRVLGGEHAFSMSEIGNNIMDNPLSYGLAFCGAAIWAVYCVVTKKIANGSNGITLFFILTALTLWVKFLLSPQPALAVSPQALLSLALAAMAMGFGYAAWNTGILHGNVNLLAAVSYFIPILSSVLAAFLLHSHLTLSFWQGAAMVSLGSLLCWWSTRTPSGNKVARELP